MEIPFVLKFFLVMISMILADIAWTFYFIKVEERKSIQSGLWSALIVLFGGISTIGYVHDPRLFVAALIGAFIGVVIAVEYKKRNELKNKS
jgi:hypothetical protein